MSALHVPLKALPPRTLAFGHIPPFIEAADEQDGYFNLSKPVRRKLLDTLRRGNCSHMFCGEEKRQKGRRL
jgi:hypothetical protein